MQVMTPARESLTARLERHAAATGDHLAYTFLECGETDGEHLTWAELDVRRGHIASAIRQQVPRGSRALLLFNPGLDFVPAFFGSLSADVIPVLAYPPSGLQRDRVVDRLRGIVADAGITLVLSTAALCTRMETLSEEIPAFRTCRWIAVDETAEDHHGPYGDTSPGDVAFLQYTSGSTAAPRGVMVTHGNLLHNLWAAERLGSHNSESASVSWLPVNHDMGLIQGVLQAAYTGFPAWLMAPAAFLQRPARWLQAISRLRATHSGGPNFAYDLCVRRVGEEDRAALTLDSWRVAFNGSEPVRPATLSAFARTFAPCGFRETAMRPSYGLAEATLLVATTATADCSRTLTVAASALHAGRFETISRTDADDSLAVSCCGVPAPETSIAIVDPRSMRRCCPGAVGEIWVSGPSVTRGYWRNSELTRMVFGARTADGDSRTYLRTGDLGVLYDGQLVVTGRIKDVLIVRGLKHDPHDIEQAVEQAHPLVRKGGCAAFAADGGLERIAVAAEIAPPAAGDDLGDVIDRIRVAVATANGIQLGAVALLAPGRLPKTTSGKVQRFQCRAAMSAGAWAPLASWDERDALTRERIA